MPRKPSSRKFIAYWCNEGLEYLADITDDLAAANDFEREKIFTILADKDSNTNTKQRELNRMVNLMIMRAMANTQRHYELYTFEADSSIDEDTIRKMFSTNPQFIVDLIREKGVQLHSDRARTKPAIV